MLIDHLADVRCLFKFFEIVTDHEVYEGDVRCAQRLGGGRVRVPLHPPPPLLLLLFILKCGGSTGSTGGDTHTGTRGRRGHETTENICRYDIYYKQNNKC